MNLHPFTGLELLARVRKHSPNAMVINTSAFGTTQTVNEAMKMGAFDFVRKEQLPFNLKVIVDSALKAHAELLSASSGVAHPGDESDGKLTLDSTAKGCPGA
jgi:two-component system nitrogen regulation response regulator GlnG